MAQILFNFYLASKRKGQVRRNATKLCIKDAQFAAAARALRKNIWTEVIDRSVLSSVSIIKGWNSSVMIRDYLRYAPLAPSVTR
ncbi:hypothetical protein, partial [Xylella fastidiosa]